MKKTAVLLMCAILTLMLALPGFASDVGDCLGTVPRTSEKMTLDGEEEALYREVGLYLDGSLSQRGGEVIGSANYWVVYDDEALWFYCVIEDSTLDSEPLDPETPNYKSDCVEIHVDFTNEGVNEAEVTPFQCRIDYLGNLSGRIGKAGESKYFRAADGGNITFFDAVAVKTDVGFNCEYRIPFPKAPEKGMNIGINICYNNWELYDYNRSLLGITEGVTSWDSDLYDYITLGELVEVTPPETEAPETAAPETEAPETTAPETTAPETEAPETSAPETTAPVTEAPQTFDVGVIAAAASVLALGGFALTKKKH